MSYLGRAIGGDWVAARSGKAFAVFDPANGQKIADVADGGAEDIDCAVPASRHAFEEGPWPAMKPTERGKLVWRLADLIEQHADEPVQLESYTNVKTVAASL